MIVSVIVPCRNEVSYISQFVDSLLQQRIDGFELEILIAEGDSDDGTTELLTKLAQKYSSLRVVSNPEKIVSTGLNRAISEARGEIIVRMDVHTIYERDYIFQCVAALQSSGAACVGGPWRARGNSLKQIAIADAFQTKIGSGGADSRRLEYSGPSDTVYLGCWWKKDLIAIGAFDEHLVRNQDDELCLRFKIAGKEIWQSANIRSTYIPRSSFKALFNQFFQYGYWKVAVAKKHNRHAALRHLLPFLFVLGISILLIASIFSSIAFTLLSAVAAVYLLTIFIGSVAAASKKSLSSILAVAWAIIIMHFSYGIGYGLGLKDFRFGQRSARSGMTKITR